MYRRHTDNGEGSSRRENPPRRPTRITVVIRDEPVDRPPPHIEREERRHPWPPLRFPPPMVRWDLPSRPLPPVPPPRREGLWARAQELLGRNRHFLDRIDREVALDRLEARQAERRAQRAQQNRQEEEARRDRHEQERRQEMGAERRREEHLEQVTRRDERNRQHGGNVPAARANSVEARRTPVNRPLVPQVLALVPAAPVATATTVNAATAPVPEPSVDGNDLVPCAVCTEEFPRSQVLTTSCAPDPHHYCGQCLQSFFSNAMDGNPGNEDPSREVRARNERFRRLLGVEMIRQYIARTEQVRMEREHTGTRCSNVDCGWLVPERFTGVEGRTETEIVCHHCRQVTCTICEGRAHRARYQERCPGHRRRTEEQQQSEEQADRQFRQLRRDEAWRTCPTCDMTVERDGGCNLVKCIKCKTYFCYHCLLIHPNGHGDGPLCACPIFDLHEPERRIPSPAPAPPDPGRHRHRHHRHDDHFLDHIPEDDDFFHGGDHRDIFDNAPEELLNRPIELDSDDDIDADDLRFILDALTRRRMP
ncbi:hypothetical protein NEUTE2DRAFT_53049 [Neurospora tetrasperma FGSC 2509]|nr:hypothetical protein NEUTE2DRAFT_53049 [Neurospora tetrasperma FGSC 2509]